MGDRASLPVGELPAGNLNGINAATLSDLPAATLKRSFLQAKITGRAAVFGAAVVLPAVAAVNTSL